MKESYDVIITSSIIIIIALCASFLLSPIWGGPILFWIGLVVAAFFLLATIGSFLPKQHDEVILNENMFDYFNGGVVFANEGSAKNQLKNKKSIEVPNIKKLKKSKSIKGLAKALSYKSSWEVRQLAALALGEIGDESAIKPLIATLKDRSIKVREATVIALAQIGGESVVDALQTALEDKEEIIQAAATDALGKLEHHTNRESQGLIENAISRQSDIPVKGKREPRKKQAVNEAAKETKQNKKVAKLKSGEKVDDPKAVKFDRKMKQGQAIYELYTSDDTEKAKEFLMKKKVKKDFFYIEVNTPNGTWGVDKDGLYLAKLLPWQKKLNLHQCEGIIEYWPTIHASTVASQGLMDNAVAGIICGNCKKEWWDGISIKNSTIVRCPKCNFYNKIKGGQVNVS